MQVLLELARLRNRGYDIRNASVVTQFLLWHGDEQYVGMFADKHLWRYGC